MARARVLRMTALLFGFLLLNSCNVPTDGSIDDPVDDVPPTEEGSANVGFTFGSNESPSFFLAGNSISGSQTLTIEMVDEVDDSSWEWTWYIDGDVIDGETTSSYTYDPSVAGTVTISVTVMRDGVLYSRSFTVTADGTVN